jgi:hypothetical protein
MDESKKDNTALVRLNLSFKHNGIEGLDEEQEQTVYDEIYAKIDEICRQHGMLNEIEDITFYHDKNNE